MKHPFKIKICGVTSIEDALIVADSDADAIGLNFYPGSKRLVGLENASDIARRVQEVRADLVLVGVFVNASVEQMLNFGETLGLNAIQLHGDEAPEIVTQLIEEAEKSGLSFDYIRAIRTSPGDSGTPMDRKQIDEEIQQWVDVGVDAILIDAAVPGDFGGTGKQVDWAGFAQLTSSVPKFLAGGLTPDNVDAAIETALPAGVDVASGVEERPRLKDESKMRRFASIAKSVFQ